MSTIVALSSGRPPAAIGVIRVSGPAAMAAGTALCGSLPPPRRAGLRGLKGAGGALLDRALVLVFPGPTSATGEDLVELHCHGGRAVVEAVEAALRAQPGCRAAEPGEFTRRALANGRIDLAEAEGLADLLEAETEAQRVAALTAAEGRISRAVRGWMDRVAALSAEVEVLIDYDDEGEGDAAALPGVAARAAALGRELAEAAAAAPVERLRDGVRVVLAGPPNAGKSTLLNLLAEREAAIVAPIAGTTRDVIEAPVRRGGYAYVLTDTAGLTMSADAVETIGVARAEQALAAADLLLWLGDEPPPRADALWLHARADQPGREAAPAGSALTISSRDRESIAALWRAIDERAAALRPKADALPLRERHRRLCGEASSSLFRPSSDPLLFAEQLRDARTALGGIIGIDATEAMLDALFSRFCLGK